MLFRCIFGVKHLAGIGVDQDRTFGSDIQVRTGMLQYALRVEVACFAVDGALSGYSPPVCQKVVAIAGDGVVKAKSGKQYISVTLGAGSSTARWQDARTLLAYAYKH